MKLAPLVRSDFDEKRRDSCDQSIGQTRPKSELYLSLLKGKRGRKSGPTWPLNKDQDVEVIGI